MSKVFCAHTKVDGGICQLCWTNVFEWESVSPAPQPEPSDDPGRCCEAGYFGDSHICLKQPNVAAPQEVKRWDIQSDQYGESSFGTYENGKYVLHSEYVSLREELANHLKEGADADCAVCLGTGVAEDETCHDCAGTGKCNCGQCGTIQISKVRSQLADMRKALEKIDAIRNDIVGTQSIGWSAHIYPLVAALGEAGYEGKSYEECKADAEKEQG